LLIRHSKYSAICQKYTPTDCFFRRFCTGVHLEMI